MVSGGRGQVSRRAQKKVRELAGGAMVPEAEAGSERFRDRLW